MPRYTASPSINGCYDINEVDADGIGKRCYFVGSDAAASPGTNVYGRVRGEDVARLIVLALNLPGGIEEATQILRAELVKRA